MGHWNWINDIYSFEDACFKYFKEQHKARELEKMLQKELGEGCLWDNEGEYIIDLKDEYEGFVLHSFNIKNRDEIKSYKELLTENEKLKKGRDEMYALISRLQKTKDNLNPLKNEMKEMLEILHDK